MNAIKRLIDRIRTNDRRSANRLAAPELAAYFWTNSAPVKQNIKDVSPTGFYLLTDERWYPGTLVMMTIQADDPENGEPKAIAVQSKAVRSGEDGVGLMFVLPDKGIGGPHDEVRFGKADKKTLNKFLRRYLESQD